MGGQLYLKSKDTAESMLVVVEGDIQEVVKDIHSLEGHLGQNKLYKKVCFKSIQ